MACGGGGGLIAVWRGAGELRFVGGGGGVGGCAVVGSGGVGAVWSMGEGLFGVCWA